jgi:uncharacterized membrane protein
VLLALAVCGAFSRSAWSLFLGLVLVYVVAVATASVALSAGRGTGLAPRVFAAFLSIHAGLVAGFWKKLLEGPRAKRASVRVGGDGR